MATAFVTLLLGIGAWQADQLEAALAANRGGAVAAAALAVPALFLSAQSRRPEHSWVARALFVPRVLTVVTALILYCVAVCLVTVRPDSPAPAAVLWSCFAVQLIWVVVAGTVWAGVSADPSTLNSVQFVDDGGTS